MSFIHTEIVKRVSVWNSHNMNLELYDFRRRVIVDRNVCITKADFEEKVATMLCNSFVNEG